MAMSIEDEDEGDNDDDSDDDVVVVIYICTYMYVFMYVCIYILYIYYFILPSFPFLRQIPAAYTPPLVPGARRPCVLREGRCDDRSDTQSSFMVSGPVFPSFTSNILRHFQDLVPQDNFWSFFSF